MTKGFLRRLPVRLILIVALLGTAACSSSRKTQPEHSATEQLLATNAVDKAVRQLRLPLPGGARVYLRIDGIEGQYASYAKAAIREEVLEQGAYLTPERADADTVIDVRSGALSIDEYETLAGMRSFEVPIPLAGNIETPEIALYKRAERRGIAKMAATAYSADEGKHIASTGQKYGFSHKKEWTMLIFFSWRKDDLIPSDQEPSKNSIELPD